MNITSLPISCAVCIGRLEAVDTFALNSSILLLLFLILSLLACVFISFFLLFSREKKSKII